MSLTAFLKIADVRERFKQEFKCPKINIDYKQFVPPLTKRYSMVGTGFDYLLRFYINCLNPNAITRPWVAEKALLVALLEGYEIEKVTEIINEAKADYSKFLKTGTLNEWLIRSALLLAQVDPIYRVSYFDPNLGSIDEKDLSKKKLTILEQKNHGKDTQPFNEQVLEVLKARNKMRSIKSNLVFYSNAGEALDGRNVLRAFYIAVKNAKIPHCRFHDLRHTFATRLA